jgi:hypothetical protein
VGTGLVLVLRGEHVQCVGTGLVLLQLVEIEEMKLAA